MAFEKARRVQLLPPYLFSEIDRLRAELAASGADVINLGVGDPDLPTPPHIIEALDKAAKDAENHQYPSYTGMMAFREAVARWYKARFNVALDPRREVLALMAEGLSNAAIAERLVVTDKAVSRHIAKIFETLGLPPAPEHHRRVLAVVTYLGSGPA